MTIQQTIQHCEEIAEHCDITDTASQYKQIADWLTELVEYKQNDFIELNAYTNEVYNISIPIFIRKKEILQFYENRTMLLNVKCTRIFTNKEIYNVKESYEEIKGMLQ